MTGRRAPAPSRSSAAISYHDRLAISWSDRYIGGGFKRRADFLVREVLPRIALRGNWIDVGCGSGVFSRILAGRGLVVLGIDGSAAMIEAARTAPFEADVAQPPRYEVGTIEELSVTNARFDGALCLSVMEYVDDPAACLTTLARLLRPNGTLVLSAPNRRSGLRRLQLTLRAVATVFRSEAFVYLASSHNAWSRHELVALAVARGLSCESIIGFDPVIPRRLCWLVPPSLWFLVCRKGGAAPPG